MIILLHVIVALTSLGYTTFVFVRPSHRGLHINYALVATTVASGTYVAWSTHARMLQACVSGLLYMGIVAFGLVSARSKLAAQKVRSH